MSAGPSLSLSEPAAQPRRVLHVADVGFFDRFGRMFRQLAIGLHEQGIDVSLLTDDARTAAELEATPVVCHRRAALSGWRAWRLDRELDEIIEPRPQIVHLWGARFRASVGGWARAGGLRTLIHVLSSADAERLARLRPHEGEYHAVGCRHFAAGFDQAGAMRSRLSSRRSVLSPPVLAPAVIVPDAPLATAREDDIFGVVWAGRIDADAGVRLLIDAALQLRRQDCELQVALVGAGPAERSLWQSIYRQGMKECFSLIDDPRLWDQALSGAHAFVVPACQRELSLAPLLAMALGRVVIASGDQLAEWFVEDVTCWHFTPGSPTELAACLRRVATHRVEAADLGRRAIEFVRKHHAMSRLSTDMTTVYRQMCRDAVVGGGHAAGLPRSGTA